MIQRLRRRFILSAMAAFFAVISLLVIAVNGWNYLSIARQQDHILTTLCNYTGQGPLPFDKHPANVFPFKTSSKELKYMVRFFSVTVSSAGDFTTINRNFIASVSSEEARHYAEEILSRGRAHGYYDGYRYLVYQVDGEKCILFLNSERELSMARTLLIMSFVIALFALALLFVLVVFFSKRAIAPFVRNLQMQKRFITDAGHELKTPLAAILTSADILSMDYGEDEWIANIKAQSNTLSHLIGELITLSKLDEEQPFFQKETFSLTDLLWDIAAPMEALAKSANKELSLSIEENLSYHGDEDSIGKMVSVLLDNALKYCPSGGKIYIRAVRDKKKILLFVSNPFTGTVPADPNLLFERFYRADSSRTEKNSFGIGLSIAKSIAQKHGGTIAVSVEGEQITFSIKLPCS